MKAQAKRICEVSRRGFLGTASFLAAALPASSSMLTN
ncbi:MAG: twin-arginine translocation signal domain-containing protein [Terracidiphilus sp.]